MEYTNKELSILLHKIKKDNPQLIYRYAYKNDGELRFVFRDMYYNHYEINDKNEIVAVDEVGVI